jgi:hypothetical protein
MLLIRLNLSNSVINNAMDLQNLKNLFLQSINPMSNPVVNSVVKTTQQAASQNKWNPGQFAGNVAQGAGDVIGGLASLPSTLVHVATNPQDAGSMATQLLKTVGGSINNTVGQPINPQTGQLQLQDYAPNKEGVVPALERAEEFAYKKPVDVAANLAMGAGAVGKVGEIGGAAGDIGKAAEAATPANWVSEGMKAKAAAQGSPLAGMNLVPKTAEELNAGKIGDVAENVRNTFLNQFDIPTKVGYRSIDKDRMANTVLSDNISSNFSNLQKAADTVTGMNGEIPKYINRALSDINQPVNLSNMLASGAVRLANEVPELGDSPGTLAKYQDVMKNIFLEPYKKGVGAPTTVKLEDALQGPVTSVSSGDAYDIMQKLEKTGYAYLNKSSYLTSNPYMEDLGHAFISTAQDIQDAIDAQLKGVDMSKYITDNMRNKLSEVSPELLQRFDATPKTIDNLRAFQKPYVDLNSSIRLTKAGAHSVWTKASKNMADALSTALGGGLGSVAGPLGMGAGAFVGKMALSPVLQPVAEALLKKYMPDVSVGAAKAMNKISAGLPAVPGVIKNIGTAGAIAGLNTQEAKQQMAAQQPQQQQAAAQQPLQAKYNLPSPQEEGFAMPIQDYTDKVSQVQQIIEQEKLNNPQQAAIDQGKLEAFQTKYQAQVPLMNKYSQTQSVLGQANNAYTIAQQAAPNILQLNGSYDSLRKQTDPKYSQLLGSLQYLQKTTGVDLSQAKTKEALLAGIDQAVNIAKIEYNAIKQQYTGGNVVSASSPSVSAAVVSPQPTGLPAQPSQIGVPVNYNFDFGAVGQGLPAVNNGGLPSIGQ